MSHSYQDFEPEFQYHIGEAHDIIEFQVKDFSKGQLKVHVSSEGVLTVSGERPQEGTKTIRFRKEINPPKDRKLKEIRAKLSYGVLYITIPKKAALQPPGLDPVKQMQRASSSVDQDKGNLKQESSSSEEAKEATTSPNEIATLPKTETKSFISWLETERKTAMKVVAGVAVLSLLLLCCFMCIKFMLT